MVLHGMKEQAKFHQEAPFACIARALLEQDIEVKSAILTFINALIMAVGDTKLRLVLRSELRSQLFDEKLDQALAQVEKELSLLPNYEEKGGVSSSPQKRLQRKSLITVFGPRAYDERKVDAMIKNTHLLGAISESGSIIGNKIEIKSNQLSVVINPLDGSMAGLLHAAKNVEKIESRFLDMVGGKKTKRRWYELDQEYFKWCGGHEKESDYKGQIKVSTIIDIRPYTTDLNVAAECQHCFEIETTDRIYALGCENATEKDNWLTALQRCRENYLMNKGTYKLQFRELQSQDVYRFAEMFRKQSSNYQAIAMEDQRHQMELVGLDLTSLIDVSRYLQLESIAMGNGANLMKVLYELLLIPAGAEGVWEASTVALRIVREEHLKMVDSVKSSAGLAKVNNLIVHDKSIVEAVGKKINESGTA